MDVPVCGFALIPPTSLVLLMYSRAVYVYTFANLCLYVRACMHACKHAYHVYMFLPWVVTKKHIQLESPNKVCF